MNNVICEVKRVSLTWAEIKDLLNGANAPLPPVAINNHIDAEEPHGIMEVSVHDSFIGLDIRVYDDAAETAWHYDLNSRDYCHAGYGPGCFWTEAVPFDEE